VPALIKYFSSMRLFWQSSFCTAENPAYPGRQSIRLNEKSPMPAAFPEFAEDAIQNDSIRIDRPIHDRGLARSCRKQRERFMAVFLLPFW
jgi:hypothetical protein